MYGRVHFVFARAAAQGHQHHNPRTHNQRANHANQHDKQHRGIRALGLATTRGRRRRRRAHGRHGLHLKRRILLARVVADTQREHPRAVGVARLLVHALDAREHNVAIINLDTHVLLVGAEHNVERGIPVRRQQPPRAGALHTLCNEIRAVHRGHAHARQLLVARAHKDPHELRLLAVNELLARQAVERARKFDVDVHQRAHFDGRVTRRLQHTRGAVRRQHRAPHRRAGRGLGARVGGLQQVSRRVQELLAALLFGQALAHDFAVHEHRSWFFAVRRVLDERPRQAPKLSSVLLCAG